METKEQKAKEYADWLHKEIEEYYGRKCGPKDMSCKNGDIRVAFLAGWDAALKSQWISTEERMPEPNTDVIFLTDIGMIMNGCYDGNCWMQMDGVWGSAYSSINKCWKVIAWMPNPSFDNVLKNK